MRIYFDLVNDRQIMRDAEGVDVDSPAEAIREVQFVLDEMQDCNELPVAEEGWHLIIRDDSGAILNEISLDDDDFHKPTIVVHSSVQIAF